MIDGASDLMLAWSGFRQPRRSARRGADEGSARSARREREANGRGQGFDLGLGATDADAANGSFRSARDSESATGHTRARSARGTPRREHGSPAARRNANGRGGRVLGELVECCHRPAQQRHAPAREGATSLIS